MANLNLQSDDFIQIEQVPIFTEFEAFDGEGNPYQIDGIILNEIARINNGRVEDGEPAVVIVGHNDGSTNEKPVLGFLTKFSTTIRNGLSTLCATFSIYKDKVNELRSFPKRSIEIYQADAPENIRWVIPCVALLGGNEPALPLGVMYQSDNKKYLKKYSADNQLNGDRTMVSEEMKAQILEVLAETAAYKYFCAQMEKDAEVIVPDVGTPTEEEKVEEAKEEAPVEEAEKEEVEDVQKEEVKEEVEEKLDEEKVKKEAYSAQLQKEHDELKKKYQRLEREKKMLTLVNEGYMFDTNEELNDSDDMTETQFDKHLTRIKKFSKIAPVAQKFSVASVNSGGSINAKGQMDMAKIEQIKMYALDNKMTYQEAAKRFQ